ncbi:hypothetical protein CLD22_24160 [Rubrivivax gelatinosus]|nr:hypothetical protein [Rubrivivax gelatinosus]
MDERAAPPPPRPRRAAWIAAAALALLAAAAGALGWVWNSEAGWRWLFGHIPGLEVIEPQGRPVSGAFSARELRWQGADGARLVIQDLAWRDFSWRWRPHAGAWIGITLEAPTASRATWTSGAPAAEPAPPRRGAPEDLRLPLELVVRQLAVASVQVDALPALSALRADLQLGAQDGTLHRIENLALAWPGGHASASGELQASGKQGLQARITAAAEDGAARPWTATLVASGTLPRVQLAATLAGSGGVRLDADATVAPFAPWPLAALQARTTALDLSALAAALPSTRLDGRVVVDSQGRDVPVQATLQLRNTTPGAWDAGRLPLASLDARLQGSLADRRTIELQSLDLRLAGERAAGRLQGQGRWQSTALTLDLALDALRPAELDHRLPGMTIAGPLKLSLQGLPSPDPADTTAPGVFGGSATLALAGRLDAARERAVTLAAEAGFSRPADGSLNAQLKRFVLAAGDARLETTLEAEADSAQRWQLRTQGTLTRFDPAMWWRGEDGSPWRRGPHALNGRWNAALALPQAALAEPLPALLAALAGDATLELRDSRLAGVPLAAQATLKAAVDDEPGAGADRRPRARRRRLVAQRRHADRRRQRRRPLALAAQRRPAGRRRAAQPGRHAGPRARELERRQHRARRAAGADAGRPGPGPR